MGSIPAGTAEDADAAVRAAREAFDSWSTTPSDQRAGYLKRAAEGLQLRQTEIATLVSQEVGMPFAYSNVVQVGLPVQSFVSIADVALDFPFERRVYNSLVVREPIGVVVAITPWNYPLHQIAAKVAPALAAGCTVVLKPSEVAPLNAFVLAEVFDSIGLPAGVFNLVTGHGRRGRRDPGRPPGSRHGLAHRFDGRRPADRRGRRRNHQAGLAGTGRQVATDRARRRRYPDGRRSAGCRPATSTPVRPASRSTRMIVPRSKLAEVEAVAKFGAESITVGDPFDDGNRLGPAGVGRAARPGASATSRRASPRAPRSSPAGPTPPDGLGHGLLRPADGVLRRHARMAIVREEIFGPVLVIQPYDDEDEAVAHRQRHDLRVERRGGIRR